MRRSTGLAGSGLIAVREHGLKHLGNLGRITILEFKSADFVGNARGVFDLFDELIDLGELVLHGGHDQHVGTAVGFEPRRQTAGVVCPTFSAKSRANVGARSTTLPSGSW